MVQIALAIFNPALARCLLIGIAKSLGLSLFVNVFLELSKFKILAIKAKMFKEHTLKGAQQCCLGILALKLTANSIDVEQNGLGRNLAATAHARERERIFNLAVKVIDSALTSHLIVFQQVGKHL